MKQPKNTYIILLYLIVVSIIVAINSTIIVDWLNKSLFVDYDINIEQKKVNESFFNGASIIFLFTILLYALVGTFIVTLLITNLLFGGLVFANQTKVIERNEFITFKELQTITSPKELLSFIDVSVELFLISAFTIILLLTILHYITKAISQKINFHIGIKTRLSIFIMATIPFLFIFQNPNFYNESFLKYEEENVHNFNPVTRARKKGFIPSFMHTVKPDYMETPLEYNKDNMMAINKKYTELSHQINNNRTQSLNNSQTIYYLSETLMDPMLVSDLIKNETPIPFISTMVDSNTGGTMYTQYIGGGTANIEWSILTSFSLEVFNDPVSVTPYSDFYVQSPNHHTILDFFKKDKLAMHPYSAHLYKRRSVYDAMNFTDFLFLNNGLNHTGKLGTHKRISDEEFHKDIKDVLDFENTGFIHALTMQNHSPFTGEIPDMEYQPKINKDVYPNKKANELTNYLQGLRATDEAVEDLIDEFEQSDRDINFLFYGDHFPSLFRGMHNQFPGDQLHETPWFIYMNHEKDKNPINIQGLSPMFFTTVLLKEGNYYVSPFHGLLNELLNHGIKRIGKDYVVGTNGYIKDEELDDDLLEMILDYRSIVYDALFGSHWLPDEFYLSSEDY